MNRMTSLAMVQVPLDAPDPPRPRSRPAPSCRLCRKTPPATTFGLCVPCLAAAAAEHAKVSLGPAVPDDADRPPGRGDGRPSSVHVRDLCGRCGSWRHLQAECDA